MRDVWGIMYVFCYGVYFNKFVLIYCLVGELWEVGFFFG